MADKPIKNKPDDMITVNTGFGSLAAPKRILDLWCRYGWPENGDLEKMTKAGHVEADSLDRYGRVMSAQTEE